MMTLDYSLYEDNELLSLLLGEKPPAERAFAELYGRYHLKLYNHCLFHIRNKVHAEDIYQITWTRFFESIKKGTDIPNVPAYLFTIANNLYKNYLRDTKHIISLDDENNVMLLERLQDDTRVENNYENAELINLVNMALNLLDEEYREAFIMKKYDGLTFREIAEIQGVSMECVKKRVARAMEKVLKMLQPYLSS